MSREREAGMAKRQRLGEANAVLVAISQRGRCFFAHQGRVSRFEIDLAGKLWLRDKYTWKRCYVAYRYRWRHFSDGGTLRRLVDALANYIRTGHRIPGRLFGPWPESYCRGDLWGYGKAEMAALRAELASSPAVEWPAAQEASEAAA